MRISTVRVWIVLCFLFALAGCGATGAGRATAKSGAGSAAYGPAGRSSSIGPAAEAAMGSSDSASSSWSPPASAPLDRDEARAGRAPDARPGLGTEWGETRTSRVHDVTFVRDSSRPFAVATLHYNDRRGVRAMVDLASDRGAWREIPAGGGEVTVSIRDEGGSVLEVVSAGGRTIVVGEAGQRYTIVLTNHTAHRLESVVTVDGLDVVDGKPGTLESRGYVLLPYATLEIEGFRQSMDEVAAFRFASVSESYAAKTGSARNVGVIGAAFFSERGDDLAAARRRRVWGADVPSASTLERDARLRDTARPFPGDPRFAQPPR